MLDEVMKKCKKQRRNVVFWKLEKIQIRELCYVDDMVIFESSEENPEENVNKIIEHLRGINLKCNMKKQKQ